MITDLRRFIEQEQPYWRELDLVLERLEKDPLSAMNVQEIRRFHYLYERVSADLAGISSFASEREARQYLESLVARAYGEIHETREKAHRLRPLAWLFVTLPRTFRRRFAAFVLSAGITCVGVAFGGLAVAFDPESREILMPYEHLVISPDQRVAMEEAAPSDRYRGVKARMTAFYITNNSQVAFSTIAMGALWGVGTVLLLLFNGVLLGAVAVDYVVAGQARFLTGWLLPHGATEIPAILIAGQAGFLLAGAMIGWRSRVGLRERLRVISSELMTLIVGVLLLLGWAAIVEAFLSQYHEPVIPYAFKIALGVIELTLLALFFALSGRGQVEQADSETEDLDGEHGR